METSVIETAGVARREGAEKRTTKTSKTSKGQVLSIHPQELFFEVLEVFVVRRASKRLAGSVCVAAIFG